LAKQPIGEAELAFLETWVSENPGSRQFVRLAWAYDQAGRSKEAVAVLQKGLVVTPEFIEARMLLAGVLEKRGDLAAAAEQLVMAAEELRNHHSVFSELARLLAQLGHEQDAERAALAAEALVQSLDQGREPAAEAMIEPEAPVSVRPADDVKVLARLEAFAQAARRRAGHTVI
jgi:Flp pilus assembly protein TadD